MRKGLLLLKCRCGDLCSRFGWLWRWGPAERDGSVHRAEPGPVHRLRLQSQGGVGGYDCYLYDRNTSSLVSLPGLNSDGYDWEPCITADGRYIAFSSSRAGGAGGADVYLYDRAAQSLVAMPGLNSTADDSDPSITGDGRYIAFVSPAPAATMIGLYDRSTRSLVRLPGIHPTGSIGDDGQASAAMAA